MGRYQLLIDTRWIEPAGGKWPPILGRVSTDNVVEVVDAAVEAAHILITQITTVDLDFPG